MKLTNLLEGLALCLWEEEVCQDSITKIASHKHKEESPADSVESVWCDLGDEDVVEPITCGRGGCTESSEVHGEDLGLVDP